MTRALTFAIMLSVVLHLVSPVSAFAQSRLRPIAYKRSIFLNEASFQIWSPVYLWARHKRMRLMLEANPRVDMSAGEYDQLLLRQAVGYQLTPVFSVWQGYAWTPTWVPAYTNESRLFQQLAAENKFARFAMTNRTRLEERYIEHLDDRTAMRLRHLIRLQAPIKMGSRWSYVFSEELFLNLNKVGTGISPGFNQNRVFVGLNRRVSDHMNVDCGYQYQYVNRNFPTEDRQNHVLLINCNFVVN